MNLRIIKGGVTKPLGYKANGLYCGIKRSGKSDLSLIVSEKPAITVGVFTKNSIKAAPLVISQKHLRNHLAQAILINSGNANCFTGNFGLIYAKRSAELIAKLLTIKTDDVLVASTGIIGKPLPYQKIASAATRLVKGLSKNRGQQAAKGILTTDTFPKEIAVKFDLNGRKVTIGACAKGSGMISPHMATMLAFITTDAVIETRMLKLALKKAIEPSFHSISVDGCMSTNDMVVVMANGLAKNKMIRNFDKNFENFSYALELVCLDLAKKIILDGEGARKFIEIQVVGAKDEKMAKKAAFAIANSNLVKTAAFGSNPNWGRVAAAVGSVGLNITEQDLKIKFSSFARKNIRIVVDLNRGDKKAMVYTCDLSLEYVRINGQYS